MKAALVWNGDEGSACAFGKVSGNLNISYLLMFPNEGTSNLATLLRLRLECEKLGVPFFWAKMKSKRSEEYREVVALLKEDYGIEAIVTDGSQDMIEKSCEALGVKVIRA